MIRRNRNRDVVCCGRHIEPRFSHNRKILVIYTCPACGDTLQDRYPWVYAGHPTRYHKPADGIPLAAGSNYKEAAKNKMKADARGMN